MRLPTYYKVLLCTVVVLLQYYSVLQSTTPYILQSTTPALLCTTKYYSVLQSTTPVLLCTTPVLQSTTPVLQSTTPVLFRTTQCYKVLQSTNQYYKALLRTKKCHWHCEEQQVSLSNLTKYCACHGEWFSRLILVTYETSFTTRGATEVTLQHHQILRLPRKNTFMIDPHHIWNVIYNARSNRGYPPTSPNTACHEKWLSNISKKFLENSWNVIYNTLLFSTLLYYSSLLLLYSTLLYSSLLSTSFYSSLLFSTLSLLLLYYSWLCDLVRISEVSHLNFLW